MTTLTKLNSDMGDILLTSLKTPAQDCSITMPVVSGKSAYDLAVENGFVGSLEDWLASIKGWQPVTSEEYMNLLNSTLKDSLLYTDLTSKIELMDIKFHDDIRNSLAAIQANKIELLEKHDIAVAEIKQTQQELLAEVNARVRDSLTAKQSLEAEVEERKLAVLEAIDAIQTEQVTRVQELRKLNNDITTEAQTRLDELLKLNNTIKAIDEKVIGVFAQVNPEYVGKDSGSIGDTVKKVGVWTEYSARIEGDVALGNRIDNLVSQVDDNSAVISQVSKTLVDSNQSLASQITAIKTEFNGNTSQITKDLESLTTTTDATNKVVSGMTSDFNDFKADIVNTYITKANSESALTTALQGFKSAYVDPIEGSRKTMESTYNNLLETYSDATGTHSKKLESLESKYTDLSGKAITADTFTSNLTKATSTEAITNVIEGYKTEILDPVLNTKVSTETIKDYYNKSEANTAINTALEEYKTEIIDPALNQKASASAVEQIENKINNSETGLEATVRKLDGVFLQVNPAYAGSNKGSVGATTSQVGVWTEVSGRIEEDYALGQRIDNLNVEVKDNAASIVTLTKAVVDTEKALASKVDVLNTNFGEFKNTSSKTIESLSTASESYGRSIASLDSKYDGLTKNAESTVLSDYYTSTKADEVTAGKITEFRTNYVDKQLNLKVEATAFDDLKVAVENKDTGLKAVGEKLNGFILKNTPEYVGSDTGSIGKETSRVGVWTQYTGMLEKDIATAKRIDNLDIKLENSTAQINTTNTIIVDKLKSLAERTEVIESEFDGKNPASIKSQVQTVSTATESSTRFLKLLNSKFETATTSSETSILDGFYTSTQTDGAIVAKINELKADYIDKNLNLKASAQAFSNLEAAVNNKDSGLEATATKLDGVYLQVNPIMVGRDHGSIGDTRVANSVGAWSEYSARLEDNYAQAKKIDTVTTTLDKNTATIQTHQESLNGLSAKYTVKLDINGRAVGFGLAADSSGAAPRSEFAVVADKFYIASPNDTSKGKLLFQVLSAPETVGSVTIPAGVYMDGAFIKYASIDTAHIRDGAIQSANIFNAAITSAKIADLAVTNAKIADATIESAKIKSLMADKIVIGNPLVGPITPAMVTGTSLTNAANLFNGNTAANSPFATYGTGTQSATSGAETNYIQVDVGATVTMPEVRFFFRGSTGRKTYIKLKASVDGVNWDYIIGSADKWETIEDSPPAPGYDYSIVTIQASFSWYGVKPYRYLRIYGNGSSASATNELVAIIGNASGSVTKIGSEGILTNSITADKIKIGSLGRDRLDSTFTQSIDDTKSKIDNLQIGGRNLIIQSRLQPGYLYSTSGVAQGGAPDHHDPTYYPCVAGEKFIGRVTDFNGVTSLGGAGYICFYDSNKVNLANYPIIANTIGTILTAVAPANTAYYRVATVAKGIKDKIEKGNKATDWTPAPEDVQNSIDIVDSKVKDIFDDNKITPDEKQSLLVTYKQITNDNDIWRNQAYKLSLDYTRQGNATTTILSTNRPYLGWVCRSDALNQTDTLNAGERTTLMNAIAEYHAANQELAQRVGSNLRTTSQSAYNSANYLERYNVDLDSYKTTGKYFVKSLTQGDTISGTDNELKVWMYLVVDAATPERITQTAWHDSAPDKIWTRVWTGYWQPWKRQTDTQYVKNLITDPNVNTIASDAKRILAQWRKDYPDGRVAIDGNAIAAHTISANQIAVGAITADHIEGGTITGNKIKANTEISAPKIKGGEININENFKVDSQGNLTARSGTFEGTVLADKISGTIDVKSLKKSAWMGGYNFHLKQYGNIDYATYQPTLIPSRGGILSTFPSFFNVAEITYTLHLEIENALNITPFLVRVDDQLKVSVYQYGSLMYTTNYTGDNIGEISIPLPEGYCSLEFKVENTYGGETGLILLGDFVNNGTIKFA